MVGRRTAARGRAGDLASAWLVVFTRRHCCTWSSWWPGLPSSCCTWSSCWPAADLLPVAELVARLAVELLHLARIGGRWSRRWQWQWLSCWPCVSVAGGVRQAALLAWPAVALLHAVELVARPAVELLHAVELVAWLAVELLHLARIGGRWWLSCSTRRHC